MKKNQNPLNGIVEHDIEALINFTGKEVIEDKNEFLEFAKNAIAKADAKQLSEIIVKKKNFDFTKILKDEIISRKEELIKTGKETLTKDFEKNIANADLNQIVIASAIFEKDSLIKAVFPDRIKTSIKQRMQNIIENSDENQLIEISKNQELIPIFELIDQDKSLQNAINDKLYDLFKNSSETDIDNAYMQYLNEIKKNKEFFQKMQSDPKTINNQNSYSLASNRKKNTAYTRPIIMTESIRIPEHKAIIRKLITSKDEILDIPKQNIIDAINKATGKELLALAENEKVLDYKYVKDAIEERAKALNSMWSLSQTNTEKEPNYGSQVLKLTEAHTINRKEIIKQLSDNTHKHTKEYKKNVISIIMKATGKELLALAENEKVPDHKYLQDAIEERASSLNWQWIMKEGSKKEPNYGSQVLDITKEYPLKRLINGTDDYWYDTNKIELLIDIASPKKLLDLAKHETVLKHEYVRNAIEDRAKKGIDQDLRYHEQYLLNKYKDKEHYGTKLSEKEFYPNIKDRLELLNLIIGKNKEYTIRQLSDDKHQHTENKEDDQYKSMKEYEGKVQEIINKTSIKDLLAITKNEEIPKHKYVLDAIEKRARGGITGKLPPGFIGIFGKKYKEKAMAKRDILGLIKEIEANTIKKLSDDQHEHTKEYQEDVLSIINKASTKELLALVDNEAVLKHKYIRDAIEKKARGGITGKLSPGLIGVFKSAYEEKAIQKREILKKIKDSKNRVNQEVIGKNETPDPHSNKIDPKEQYTDTPQKVENTAESLENSLKMQQQKIKQTSLSELQHKNPQGGRTISK